MKLTGVLESTCREIVLRFLNKGLGTVKTIRPLRPLPEANVQWLVDLLGIFAPEDEIFKKSYKYVRPRQDIELLLDNEDGFFDDLPELDEKYVRKTKRLQMPKKVRQNIRL